MWFCAATLKVAEHNGRRVGDALWEEQFFLIESDSEELARKEVERIAKRPEAPYKNKKGELISWKFVRIDRVFAIAEEKLGHGVEVFCRFLRESEAKSLMTPFDETKL